MEFSENYSLKSANSFGFDVAAEYCCEVTSLVELREALAFADSKNLDVLVLGGGSNLILVSDIPGLVILNRLRGITVKADVDDPSRVCVTAAAGENWHDFVRYTLECGAYGLENLSLIPGTVGAAPMQNIGAYGVEIKDRMLNLTALDRETGELCEFTTEACEFGYRDSIFKQRASGRYIITEVNFMLSRECQPVLAYAGLADHFAGLGIESPDGLQISDYICQVRRAKLPDPAEIGNAGSFFKNPVVSAVRREAILKDYPDLVSFADGEGYKLAAGWLIDRLGWKGRCQGHAAVYDKQALVLVNHGGASGDDILRLAQAIQEDVFSHFKVRLEIEPRTFPQ
ncbi:UDP-N-acetylmuramate dehydrogenase [Aliamphritea hakodatensis]|uniref:UDP-N-acetylmuramate dehydrogenase n=1 Tax=Aliamphritea hakodatensis TaxID=2895352 RepID=UPI0022FD49EF|nr:UDP-N-acetylmuramate dehydrogenase [Aliamphritea hakodatensis]